MRRDRSRGGENLLPGPPPVGKGTGDKLQGRESFLSKGEKTSEAHSSGKGGVVGGGQPVSG